ncbi:MAG: Dna2/Cas4 domain-containing protein [Clostridia bacterium]|nr:Dna2/Cas4 domain-containing protein [Clostridia bacterium]
MNITGIMIYYYFVCQRRLWYFINQINMEQNSELVKIGKILDETTYTREKKQILIDNTINIDFIKNKAVLHEVKKTKAVEEAGIWQIKYYIYYLENKGVQDIKAKIDFPLLRETKEVILEDKDREILKNVIIHIEEIGKMDKPPEIIDSRICRKCSYFDMCYV